MESSQEREVTLQAPCYIFTDNAVLVVSVAIIIATCAAILTSIKNEVGCRDDTVPKTVDTRRHCEEE